MRTICSVSSVLLISCAGGTPGPAAAPSSNGTDGIGSNGRSAPQTSPAAVQDSLQFVDIATPGGKKIRVPVEGDQYVRVDAGVDVQVLAETGSSLVVIDTYLSRAGGGSYCQAGQERFLRILRMDADIPQVTMRLKLASCWQEIELTDPGVEWSATDSTLRVNWLFGPTSKMQPEELTLRLMHQ